MTRPVSVRTTERGWFPPQWILQRHPPDELPQLRWNRRPSRAGLPSPESLKPARCQRIGVCGRTTTSAERHANSRDSSAKLTRVAASIRLGFTPRSTHRASCRRRNRTSASSDWRDRNASATHPTRSVTLARQ